KIASLSGSHVFNACGKLSVHKSADAIRQSLKVITHDTGMMHIAAAFNKPMASIWGNTIPEFGMYPYMPANPDRYKIFEVKGLKCRPCSKLGYRQCPKKHFYCMNLQETDLIADWANS
ncbi:MAG: glycosyl transferase, partial [Bacteroidetes bacterium]